MCVQWEHPEEKHWNRLFWQKLFLCLYAWMALMPSFTATRFAVFNTLYIKLHDSNHWWSQCQNITGIHRYSAAHSLCSGGWFRAVFQPCAACGSTIVSKRLQSALHAGAEALIQTANAPVSHRSLWTGRGRSGFMDLTQPCGASKATGALQRTAEMKPWVAVPQRTFIYKGIEGQDGASSPTPPHEWVHNHSVLLHGSTLSILHLLTATASAITWIWHIQMMHKQIMH